MVGDGQNPKSLSRDLDGYVEALRNYKSRSVCRPKKDRNGARQAIAVEVVQGRTGEDQDFFWWRSRLRPAIQRLTTTEILPLLHKITKKATWLASRYHGINISFTWHYQMCPSFWSCGLLRQLAGSHRFSLTHYIPFGSNTV